MDSQQGSHPKLDRLDIHKPNRPLEEDDNVHMLLFTIYIDNLYLVIFFPSFSHLALILFSLPFQHVPGAKGLSLLTLISRCFSTSEAGNPNLETTKTWLK